jgi:O-antigen ligase
MTLAATLLSGYALFLSGSRGPILSAVITVFAVLIYIYRVKAVVFLTIMSIILVIVISQNQSVKDKIIIDRGTPGTESSIGTRIILWQTAIKGISERPVFGFGKGTFTQYVKKNVTVPLSSTAHAHNSYLQYAFSNGLFGSVFLIGFIVSLFNYLRRRAKEYPPAKAAIFVFIVFLLEGLTENNFGDSEVVMLTMLILAILTAPVRSYKNL